MNNQPNTKFVSALAFITALGAAWGAVNAQDNPPRPTFDRGIQDYFVDDHSSNDWLSSTGYKRIWVEWEMQQSSRLRGKFVLRGSSIRNLIRLGSTGDELVTIQNDERQVNVRPGQPHKKSGFVFETDVAPSTVLVMDLQNLSSGTETRSHVVSLAELGGSTSQFDLAGGIRLQVRKEPSPTKLLYNRPHLVFDPGETFDFEVQLDEVPRTVNSLVSCVATLTPARSDHVLEVHRQESSVDLLGQFQGLNDFTIPMPQEEGAYRLHIETRALQSKQDLTKSKMISKRTLELVVLDPAAKQLTPRNGDYWKLLQNVELSKVDVIRQKQTSSHVRSVQVAGLNPGVPHLVEVVCLAKEPCRYRVAIKRASVESGEKIVEADFKIDKSSDETSVHQTTFWPIDDEVTIDIEQIGGSGQGTSSILRLYAGSRHLPRVAEPAANGRRSVVAYLESPVAGSRFGAEEAEVRDWKYQLDYQERQLQLLNNFGYSSVMMTVAASGGTTYPSMRIGTSAGYENGECLPPNVDTPKKDVLELMLRMYDREQMKLIPAVRFDFPIKKLENQIACGNAELRMVNGQRQSWWDANPDWGPSGPYYDPANPMVQLEVQNIVDELVIRYGKHEAFGGVALVLDDNTYLQIHEDRWGDGTSTASSGRANAHLQQLKELIEHLAAGVYDPSAGRRLYVVNDSVSNSGSLGELEAEFLSKPLQSVAWVSRGSSEMLSFTQSSVDRSVDFKKRKTLFVARQNVEVTGSRSRQELMRHLLASDADLIVQDVSTLETGVAAANRGLLLALNALPIGSFKDVRSRSSEDETICVRTATSSVASYGYVVNDSMWPLTVELNFNSLAGLQVRVDGGALATKQQDSTLQIRIAPRDVVSFRVSNAEATISDWKAVRDQSDSVAMLTWCERVRQRLDKAKGLQMERCSVLVNPDFEKPSASDNVPGWDVSRGAGLSAELCSDLSPATRCLMVSTETPFGWPSAPIGWVRSNTFPSPASGRLLIRARLRAADDFEKTRVRMIVSGRSGGIPVEESTWISPASQLDGVYRIGEIRMLDLSAGYDDGMRVMLEVHGGGQVWIEEVSAFDQFLEPSEITMLETMHAQAVSGINRHDYSGCVAMRSLSATTKLLGELSFVNSDEFVSPGSLPIESVVATGAVSSVEPQNEMPNLSSRRVAASPSRPSSEVEARVIKSSRRKRSVDQKTAIAIKPADVNLSFGMIGSEDVEPQRRLDLSVFGKAVTAEGAETEEPTRVSTFQSWKNRKNR